MRTEMQHTPVMKIAELARRIQRQLETEIGTVCVRGEVSNLRIPASGHAYFMLKDDQAAINAICFRGALSRQRSCLREGVALDVTGRVTAYAPRSQYQIIVETMRAAGEGDLMRRLQELKEKLQAEGLFDADKKRELPTMPTTVGVVTSSTGAALRDILQVLGRRVRGMQVLIAPAAVQGEQAPEQIVAAIKHLERDARPEVIIVGRGGGSIEDLWAFNDERVVRAVAASTIPVIAAVGHETDTTLTDYAADLRAPTPSAAAELVCAHHGEVIDRLTRSQQRLQRAMRQQLQDRRSSLGQLVRSWGLRRPQDVYRQACQRHDEARMALMRGIEQRLARAAHASDQLRLRLRHQAPLNRLERLGDHVVGLQNRMLAAGPRQWRGTLQREHQHLGSLSQRLKSAMTAQARGRARHWEDTCRRLEAVSPQSVLKRGYSIVTHGRTGKLITRPDQLREGESFQVRSSGGNWRGARLNDAPDMFDEGDVG